VTDVEGLDTEECRTCSQDPNTCETSNIYQEVQTLSQVAAKQGLHYDTRGMSCHEILRMLKRDLGELETQKRYTVFTTGRSFEVRATNIDEAWKRALCSQIVSYNDLTVENVMLHYSELRSYIDISEVTEIECEDEFGKHKRQVCPECRQHIQGKTGKVYDCKTVFTKDKTNVGQCQCYSEEHGRRSD